MWQNNVKTYDWNIMGLNSKKALYKQNNREVSVSVADASSVVTSHSIC